MCENLLQLLEAVDRSKYHAWYWQDREYLLMQLKEPLNKLNRPDVQLPVSCGKGETASQG